MAEGSVNFTTKHKGYDKEEVDQFVKDVEVMLQDKALMIAKLQGEIAELEAKLQRLMGEDLTVAEKAERRTECYLNSTQRNQKDFKNITADFDKFAAAGLGAADQARFGSFVHFQRDRCEQGHRNRLKRLSARSCHSRKNQHHCQQQYC